MFLDIIVIFPFRIPVFVPLVLYNGVWDTLSALRLISSRRCQDELPFEKGSTHDLRGWRRSFVRLRFPMNMVTAPLIADLFLLAILAIGKQEVHDGTVGTNNISPIDIMAFFFTLAYIAISIDASGLVRFLAYKVLQKGGKVGHRLFFYLYAFFFSLGTFIGNDPIILSGTAFLAYMTRVSSNIKHPRAWIHSQFAVANISSAILVSSNPTNLVLAGAFSIKFIVYTANMIVPVVVTAVVLFPFLLYIIFADEKLIPMEITMHELSNAQKEKPAVNPNIPHSRGVLEEDEEYTPDGTEKAKSLPLEEIMNPFLDRKGAAFGALVMTVTLITVLALNASSQAGHERPIFYVTLPAAFVMFVWDVVFGWLNRHKTREIARKGREEIQRAREERAAARREGAQQNSSASNLEGAGIEQSRHETILPLTSSNLEDSNTPKVLVSEPGKDRTSAKLAQKNDDMPQHALGDISSSNEKSFDDIKEGPDNRVLPYTSVEGNLRQRVEGGLKERDLETQDTPFSRAEQQQPRPATLASLSAKAYRWSQETFPTVTVVVTHLPWALIPFAFAMFVLVQSLVSKGWVQVFAYGWDHWVNVSGNVGAIGGMGFLSVVLCNVSYASFFTPYSDASASCHPQSC